MSKQKQTPGPWSVNTDKNYEDGEPGCVWGPQGPGYGVVCDLPPTYPRKFNAADAKLIAAAPELLVMLEECERTLRWAAQEAEGRVRKEIVGGWRHHADRAAELIKQVTSEGD